MEVFYLIPQKGSGKVGQLNKRMEWFFSSASIELSYFCNNCITTERITSSKRPNYTVYTCIDVIHVPHLYTHKTHTHMYLNICTVHVVEIGHFGTVPCKAC